MASHMVEEDNEDSAYRDNLWKIIETGMPAKVPTYINNILHLSGYEDISVLRNFDVVKIEKLEQFTRNKILDLLDVPTNWFKWNNVGVVNHFTIKEKVNIEAYKCTISRPLYNNGNMLLPNNVFEKIMNLSIK